MFNFYQSINKKEEDPNKEPDVIGHERWYQERQSRSSVKKKKKPPRIRAQSVSEFPPQLLNATSRRAAFKKRSQSSESRNGEDRTDEDGGNVKTRTTMALSESFSKVLFSRRSSSTQKHEYSALKTDGGNGEKFRLEKQIKTGAFLTCKQYLANNDRYALNNQLCDIGSRVDKNWFTVQDEKLRAQRLLILLPLPSTCSIILNKANKETLLELFRGLQHPYIHPILDLEFWDSGIALITPLNPDGSLRDFIYRSPWDEEFSRKYAGHGEGLPLKMIQCLGRQILEGLLFLKNRDFPTFRHLHSGNVIIQNGVARLAGLENTLFGLPSKLPSPFETIAFGYLLFEMAAGYELTTPLTQSSHLHLELEKAFNVVEVLDFIFKNPRPPTIEEVIYCELFRGVELRELRGASITPNRMTNGVFELLEVVRNPVPPSPARRRVYEDHFVSL